MLALSSGLQDLATYRITAFDPNLELEEAAVGIGDLCGSVLLNTKFLDLVERKVGTLSAEDRKDVRRIIWKIVVIGFTNIISLG